MVERSPKKHGGRFSAFLALLILLPLGNEETPNITATETISSVPQIEYVIATQTPENTPMPTNTATAIPTSTLTPTVELSKTPAKTPTRISPTKTRTPIPPTNTPLPKNCVLETGKINTVVIPNGNNQVDCEVKNTGNGMYLKADAPFSLFSSPEALQPIANSTSCDASQCIKSTGDWHTVGATWIVKVRSTKSSIDFEVRRGVITAVDKECNTYKEWLPTGQLVDWTDCGMYR